MRYPNPSQTRLAVGTFLLSASVLAQAATLSVTTELDEYDGMCDSHCSLRDAVTVANQSGKPTTIDLPAGAYGLTRVDAPDEEDERFPADDDSNLVGDLDITGDLRIRGDGLTRSFIHGLGKRGLFAVDHRLIEVRPGARLTLENLTLTDGNARYNGSGLENHGQATLYRVRLENNRTRNSWTPDPWRGHGGAIANYGELILGDTHFEGNVVANGCEAYGGAIYNTGKMQIRASRFQRNHTATFCLEDGPGGAIYNTGFAEIWDSVFTRNDNAEFTRAGIIANEGGELVIGNSTLTGNHHITLSNGLLDSAERRSRTTLRNVTLARNVGRLPETPAVLNGGELLAYNSIVAGNYSKNVFDDYHSSFNCEAIGDHASVQASSVLSDAPRGNYCGAEIYVDSRRLFSEVLAPRLTQHENTWTLDLLPGSPAIDAGLGECPSLDQRGRPRPQDGNGDGAAICDLGAYELNP